MLEENNNFTENQGENQAPLQEFPATPENPYSFIIEEHRKKKEIRRLAAIIGIPCLCLSAIGFLWSFPYLFLTVKVMGMSYADAVKFSQNPAIQQVLQIILSTFMFLVPFTVAAKCAGVRIDNTVMFEKSKKSSFLPLFLFGIGFCSFANVATTYVSAIFQNFGIDYDVNFGENPSGVFGFLLTFISTAIVPALVEEFACRGIVLGLLKKHGKAFAVITSSVIFGIMHGNFEQMPFAVMVGLILGYIYVKTENIWICVAVHSTNNAISVILSYLENITSSNVQNLIYIIYLIISMLAAILGVLLFAKNGKENYELEKSEEKIKDKQKYKWFFTSWAIVLFVVINLIEALKYFVV